jgi:hypothetical protein
MMGDQFAFGQLVQAKGLDTQRSVVVVGGSTTTIPKWSDDELTCDDIVQAIIERARLCRVDTYVKNWGNKQDEVSYNRVCKNWLI